MITDPEAIKQGAALHAQSLALEALYLKSIPSRVLAGKVKVAPDPLCAKIPRAAARLTGPCNAHENEFFAGTLAQIYDPKL